MKTLTLSALALTVFAGMASASADFARYGVDQDSLTTAQELAIKSAIASDKSFNEVQAVVNTIVNKG